MIDPPIRVLWAVKGLGPGGVERLLVNAARTHDYDMFQIDCAYMLRHKDALVDELEAAGVTCHPLGVGGSGDPRWLMALGRLARRLRPDVCHIHSPLVAGLARPLLRAVVPRCATVTTEHNGWGTLAPATRLLAAATFPLDRFHLAVSEETRSSLPLRWQGEVEVLTHGVVLADAVAAKAERSRTRAELGVADHEVVVATVANYRTQKAWPDLLAAVADVRARGLPARFVGVGQGPLAAEVERRHRELGLGDGFTLLGRRNDVLRILAGADVFVLASTFEGLPVAVMEAIAVGLPVVATAVGGIPELVPHGHAGLLVPPGRPRELADALAAVIVDPGLRARLTAGAAALAGSVDVTVATRRVEDLYRALAAGPAAVG